MRFQNLVKAVYYEPWLILPSAHAAVARIVAAKLQGSKMDDITMDDFMPDPMPYEKVGGVQCIPMDGIIGRRLSAIDKKCGGCDSGELCDMLDAAMNDESVTSVLLQVDSPGGMVSGTPECAAKVSEVNAVKPVCAYTSGMMCSAAYYIASGCRMIYGSPSCDVGSIGVYMALLDSSQYFEDMGLKMDVIKDGKYKAAGLTGTSLTDEQRSLMQAEIKQIGTAFRAWVSRSRPTVSAESMQGQSFMGWEALKAGLLDEISTRDQAIADTAYVGDRNQNKMDMPDDMPDPDDDEDGFPCGGK